MRSVSSLVPAALLALGLTGAALPVAAHHSFAMFDSSEVREMRGVVHSFNWSNPHVALFLRDGGSTERADMWSIELTSPGNLRRLGWTRTTLRPGDEVIVAMNPLRDGRNGGGFRSVTFVDTGETLTASLIDIERDR